MTDSTSNNRIAAKGIAKNAEQMLADGLRLADQLRECRHIMKCQKKVFPARTFIGAVERTRVTQYEKHAHRLFTSSEKNPEEGA